MTGRRPGVVLFMMATLVLVGSCAAPFSPEVLARAEDSTKPVIEISSPADESYYAKTVVVSGVVTDSTASEGVAGSIEQLTYEIASASVSEEIAVASDGSFSFEFSTVLLSGSSITLVITAVDGNGNSTSITRTLLYGGSDIASFDVTPQNQSVLISWDSVDGATGYTVRNVGTAEEVVLDPTASSYTWSELDNGSISFFQLEATDLNGQTNVSSEVSAIPLSPYTLLPTTEARDDRVRISWRQMPGVDNYVLEKASAPEGPYFKRMVTAETDVEDPLVSRGAFYYYRVYPDGQDDVKSAWAEARLLPYSTTGTIGGDYFGPLLGTRNIVEYGDYVLATDRDEAFNYLVRVLDASDPSALVEVSTVSAAADIYAMALDADEQLLYLAVEEQGVQAIDISDLQNPSVVGTQTGQYLGMGADSSFNDIAVTRTGGSSYIVGVGYDSVRTGRVDYSGDTVNFVATEAITSFANRTEAIAISGSTAYVTLYDGSQIGYDTVDVSDPETSLPRSTGFRITDTIYAPGSIDLNADYVVIDDGTPSSLSSGEIYIVDVTNDTSVASQTLDESVLGLDIDGGIVSVSTGVGGVIAYDLRSAPAPSDLPVMTPEIAGSAQGSTVVNGFLIVAATTSVESFELLPLVPASSTKYTIGSGYTNMYDFASVGTNAYFANLGVIYRADISDLGALQSGGLTSTSLGGASQVFVQGDRTLMGSSTDDLIIATTSPDGTNPSEIGSASYSSQELHTIGDITYGFQGSLIAIYDTSDSTNMVHIKSLATNVSIIDMASRGNYLYAAYGYSGSYGSGESGLVIFDTSDPLKPTEVSRFDASTYFNNSATLSRDYVDFAWHDMDLNGDHLYFAWSDHGPTFSNSSTDAGADDASGLVVFSTADDPEQPKLVGEWEGEDVFTDAEAWTKRFELIEVDGHLAVLSSGFAANATQYEGRVVLVDVGDLSSITKLKDLLPSGGYAAPGDVADFPQSLDMWYGTYVFVAGRNELTYFEL